MATMEPAKKKPKSSFRRLGLPSELLSELFGSLPFEKAFAILAKMPNGLLVRNVHKMVKSIKEGMKNNKWNAVDCGSGLAIFEDEIVANKHSGSLKFNCIRTILPIPTLNLKINKSRIAFYFEVQILAISIQDDSIIIGFCDQFFPLEAKSLGYENSIGIWHKRGIYIDGDICLNKIWNCEGLFTEGDVIGLGIIQQPNSKLECFTTWNGKLLGKAELPPKFGNFRLFPAVDLVCINDSIRVNFGKQEWQFKEFQSVLH